MKLIVAILTTTILFITNSITAQNNTITATVINVTSDTGKVGYALYDKTNFRMKPIQGAASKIVNGKSVVVFENVAAGEYAIICYHDKNNNDKMDFEANGMPLEDYGASNNVMNFGPPKFEDAKFTIIDKNVSLEIKF
ncbi:DUF2141 domain-containing protein [Polaribacter sp. SA4-12]|uniref:DUF2141 domain-containing protein n=1 Tax=Polaribacter sp. SA4-12 TaxID=1312072 RepID=UPI000B3CC630|nr:DUF2141 domain-containing protein [Polaribacter sp. SA4-12]ARV13932.1 hypothetical protein BTO07_01685 [Polaribacter sp. SA4-12]